MSLDDRLIITLGEAALDRLRNSKVVICGLGSLGGDIAFLLAMNQIGYFVLVDPDSLEPHNVPRHIAGNRYVGWSKVDAVAALIYDHNPSAIVEVYQKDAREVTEQFHGADLIIVAGLGSEQVTANLANRYIRPLGIPALYAGLFKKAVAGDAFFIDTDPTGPCYACLASKVSDIESDELAQPVDYGMPQDQVQAQPGLGMDVMSLGADVARWALAILVGDESIRPRMPGNHVTVANQEYTTGGVKPFTLYPGGAKWLYIGKLPGCLVCDVVTENDARSLDEILK